MSGGTFSMRRRLEDLERLACRQLPQGSERAREAVRALFDVLEVHYPADPWRPGCVPSSVARKVGEAASRVAAGSPTEVDTAALAALATCLASHPGAVALDAPGFLLAVGQLRKG